MVELKERERVVGLVTQLSFKAAGYLIGGRGKGSSHQSHGKPIDLEHYSGRKRSHHVEKVLADLKGIEDRKQGIIADLLRQRPTP
jgi:hypothetical protein